MLQSYLSTWELFLCMPGHVLSALYIQWERGLLILSTGSHSWVMQRKGISQRVRGEEKKTCKATRIIKNSESRLWVFVLFLFFCFKAPCDPFCRRSWAGKDNILAHKLCQGSGAPLLRRWNLCWLRALTKFNPLRCSVWWTPGFCSSKLTVQGQYHVFAMF